MFRPVIIPPYYLIAGLVKNKPVFWATDDHSGGYPYWEFESHRAIRFTDLAKASKELEFRGYMYDQASEIRIVLVDPIVEEIGINIINDEIKKSALAKLSETERTLLGL